MLLPSCPGRLSHSSLAAGAARVINTASASHQGAALDFDDLQSAQSFGAVKAYGRSKLCNILFTRELARRFRGTGVTANCLHYSGGRYCGRRVAVLYGAGELFACRCCYGLAYASQQEALHRLERARKILTKLIICIPFEPFMRK
jgi:NAD(P)-dependent dehydrogenase (short-subunit alcohol dehydrogenase family)